ncbi:MAG: hypothetical protein H6625_11140 [Bdellovibrionaceae bacterium]|nr:hypothetical protein [Pseudobdellovibrionaceae bacterium]
MQRGARNEIFTFTSTYRPPISWAQAPKKNEVVEEIDIESLQNDKS